MTAAPDPGPDPTIRRLAYADLPQVIAIERRAFPTPWSLAMFVLELSKSSGVCLAATVEGRVTGYVVCSRYADVWHVMNVAVDPDHRRRGLGRALLEHLLGEVGEDALIMWRTPGTLRGSVEGIPAVDPRWIKAGRA